MAASSRGREPTGLLRQTHLSRGAAAAIILNVGPDFRNSRITDGECTVAFLLLKRMNQRGQGVPG
jgi:hypothetical protein